MYEDFQTPWNIAKYMVGLIPQHITTVLYATPRGGNVHRALAERDFEISTPKEVVALEQERYDCVVMNPPLQPMRATYDLMWDCMYVSDYIVALLPWFALINSDKRAVTFSAWGLRSVTHLPRSTFGVTRIQPCILELDRTFVGDTRLHFFMHSHRKNLLPP